MSPCGKGIMGKKTEKREYQSSYSGTEKPESLLLRLIEAYCQSKGILIKYEHIFKKGKV
jgi:hypothetical protein